MILAETWQMQTNKETIRLVAHFQVFFSKEYQKKNMNGDSTIAKKLDYNVSAP